MTNGRNSWGVSFSHITWFERLLDSHKNVANIERHDDIIFEIDRQAQRDHLKILCCNEYTMGLTLVQRGLEEFGALNMFHIGGGWCGYTRQAKEFCVSQSIGLFVTNEMGGALWKNEHWAYHTKDEEGDPFFYYRAG